MTSGRDRYPRIRRKLSPPEFAALGTPLAPADIYIVVRRLLRLDDRELLDTMAAGAAALAAGAEGYLAEMDDPDAAAASGASTGGRHKAWRRRARQMTWDELRVFLLGLSIEDQVT